MFLEDIEKNLGSGKTSARVAATVFQEEAFISGLLLENSWKDPVKIPMTWRSRANQKSINNEPKTDPRRGTPSVRGRLEGLLGGS